MATASQKTAQTVSIDDFVGGLHKLSESDFTGVEGTLQYLRSTHVDPETLKPYLFWNRSITPATSSTKLTSTNCWHCAGSPA